MQQSLEHIFTQAEINANLIGACTVGNLKQVQYCLHDSRLQYKAQIHCNNESPIFYASINDNMEVIEYLLTSSEVIDKPIIQTYEERLFIGVFEKKQTSVLEYFIWKRELILSDTIEEFLSFNTDIKFANFIHKQFNDRDLYFQLQKTLTAQTLHTKKYAKI